MRLPAIKGIGGAPLNLIDRYEDGKSIYDIDFEFIDGVDRHPPGHGLKLIDHMTHNVYKGRMAYWSGFYEKLFNFKEIRYFDIKGEYTGLTSQAMMAPDGVIRIPLNEESVKTGGHPAHDRAQRHSAWGDSGGCGLSGLPVFVGATTPSRMTLEQGNLLTRGRVSREGSVILRVLRLKLGENKTQIGLSLSKKFVKESADVLAEMKAMA